jgi:FkbM family methyltransferase
MHRRLQPLGRTVYRLEQRLRQTTIGSAVAIYGSETKPLTAIDSWRLARMLNTRGRGAGLVSIRPRALLGGRIWLRRGTSDADVAMQTFVYRLHAPPSAPVSPMVVWDLGSNIGLTVAHYACLYPGARVVGVEPDPDNAALARRNIQPWSERCTLVECAVWSDDGEVGFELRSGDEAGRIVENAQRRVRACSLTTLLQDEDAVDLLKMDIEGAEQAVLQRNTDWAAKVRNVIVEVHEPYTPEECIGDLEGLGFGATVNPRFWVSIVGTR